MTKNLGGGAPGEGKCNALAARLRMNAATEIRVVAQEYSGRCYLHIRQYFLGDDNEFRPTQKGVSLSIDKLGEVLDAVRGTVPRPRPWSRRARAKRSGFLL